MYTVLIARKNMVSFDFREKLAENIQNILMCLAVPIFIHGNISVQYLYKTRIR